MNSLFRTPRLVLGLLPVACVSVALVLTASGNAATSRADRVNALVVGTVRACGGLPSPGYRHVPCRLDRRATVSIFSADHRFVASESITNGHFSFVVRPGKYTLRSTRGGYRATRRVTAKANKTVHTNIGFSLK